MQGTRAYIHLSHLRGNIASVVRRCGNPKAVCLAVKANAYGHGSAAVAAAAVRAGVTHLGVAYAGEAVELREAGITEPIIIFGVPFESDYPVIARLGLETFVSGPEEMEALEAFAERMNSGPFAVHLKINTGMNRIGCDPHAAAALADRAAHSRHLELKGTATHLAVADCCGDWAVAGTERQLDVFEEAVEAIRRRGIDPGLVHSANSAGAIAYPERAGDMIRPGIAAYGYYPSAEFEKRFASVLGLRPVMEMRTSISFVKKSPADTPVSYGWTYRTPDRRWIGTLPIGYADGLPRRLSNRMSFRLAAECGAAAAAGGREIRQIGTICMDQCMIDLGPAGDEDVPPCAPGGDVVVFGGDAPESAQTIADALGTIPYEITCGISPRVKRIPVD